MTTPREDAIAALRLRAWAECVQRLIKVAPTEAVMNETGARYSGGGHATPPERKAIREAAAKVVDGWLARDLALLAAEADRGTFVQGIRDPKATARSIADAALDAAREAAESRPDPKHGPHGNEGYCYCGVFVGHDGDWSSHRADPTPEPDR